MSSMFLRLEQMSKHTPAPQTTTFNLLWCHSLLLLLSFSQQNTVILKHAILCYATCYLFFPSGAVFHVEEDVWTDLCWICDDTVSYSSCAMIKLITHSCLEIREFCMNTVFYLQLLHLHSKWECANERLVQTGVCECVVPVIWWGCSQGHMCLC